MWPKMWLDKSIATIITTLLLIYIYELLILSFTGKFLSWWNHYLTEESKEEIKSAVQKDKDGHPTFDKIIGEGGPDGVNTLIYTITRHFIGTPSNITTKIHDQLNNLRFTTLSDYSGTKTSYQHIYIYIYRFDVLLFCALLFKNVFQKHLKDFVVVDLDLLTPSLSV